MSRRNFFPICVCLCACVCVCLHGLRGEVLAEVPHDVEGIDGGGGQDASGRLVTQVCQWVGGPGGHKEEEEEEKVIGQETRGGRQTGAGPEERRTSVVK